MPTPTTSSTQIDPVCGMEVDPSRAAGSSVYAGRTTYFCSPGCKAKFDKNPGQFSEGSQPESPAGGCCS